MLLEEFDPAKNAVIDPEMVVQRIENFPEVTVSCFSKQLFNSVLALFDAEKIAEIHSATGRNPVYVVEYKGRRFAFFQSLVGEPLCVGQYEDVIAMGSRRLSFWETAACWTSPLRTAASSSRRGRSGTKRQRCGPCGYAARCWRPRRGIWR